MGAKSKMQLREEDLLKSIEELESFTKGDDIGSDQQKVPAQMKSTRAARGGTTSYRSPAGQDASLQTDNEDAEHFDMEAGEGEAEASRKSEE